MWMCRFLLMVLDSVFFFKQKTAYEMRISDWSSDVCSSDLIGTGPLPHPTTQRQYPMGGRVGERAGAEFRIRGSGGERDRIGGARAKIGRASCRERVCQYV